MQEIHLGLFEFLNIVLTLIIFIQWRLDRAREGAVKNGILVAREVMEESHDIRAQSALTALDGALATLGSRKPFEKHAEAIISGITARLKKQETKPLRKISPLTMQEIIQDPSVNTGEREFTKSEN